MKKIKAYLANQLGFSETGRYVLENLIKPKIAEIGILIYDPFEECEKELDLEHVAKLEKYEDVKKYWKNFNKKITPTNNELMQKSDCLLAILDGGHAVDDGVSSEIGYYAGIERGPIFALRSDLRGGENIATSINSQVMGYILLSKGKLVDGQDAMNKWLTEIKKWHNNLSKK